MQMKRKGENHTKSSFLGIALANICSASRDKEIMAAGLVAHHKNGTVGTYGSKP